MIDHIDGLGNNGEPVVDESRVIDLAMDTYEPEADHDLDMRDQMERTEYEARQAEDRLFASVDR